MKKPKSLQLLLVFAAALFFLPIAPAAQAQMATDEGLEITGLVLDETKTKGGHEFYEFFTVNWNTVPGVEYTIHIMEQPDLGRGSSIKVLIDDTQVFFQRLNPRTDVIEEAAKNAVQTVRLILIRQLLTRQELDGPP